MSEIVKKEFIPSPNQQAIFNFIINGKGNAVVSAVAGSGKTTTILKSLNLIPSVEEVLYLAFNKDIVSSIKEKNSHIPNVTFKTLHGYGFSILQNNNKNIVIDNYKYRKMLRCIYNFLQSGDIEEIEKYKFTNKQIQNLDKFVIESLEEDDDENKFKQRVINLCNLGRLMLISDAPNMCRIADKYGIEYLNNECVLALELIALGERYDTVIDYTDMLYFPVKFNLHGVKYEWVFVDECQDLNVAQRLLMLMAIKPGGRFIAVGDPHQAIYGFAGADVISFQSLVEHPNTIELPLSVCYRCDKQIIDIAKTLVAHIEFFDKNGEGQVNHDSSMDEIVPGDMVLCRNTYPLVRMCFDFLRDGIPAIIKGRDIGTGLIQMIEESKKENINELFDYLYHELDKTKQKLIRKHHITEEEAEENEIYQGQKERIEIIELLSEGAKTSKDISNRISDMFSDSDVKGVQLSTIHRAKGLESDKVFLIHPELMPSKYAKMDWQREQEQNLRYVAYTRAKNYLGFVTDFDAYKGKSNHDRSATVKKIKESSFVGFPGQSVFANIKVTMQKDIKTSRGLTTTLWKFVDEDGNFYSKFGSVPAHFFDEYKDKFLECYVTIKEHKAFNGVKENNLSKIMTAEDVRIWERIKKDQESKLDVRKIYELDLEARKKTTPTNITYHENIETNERIKILREAVNQIKQEGKTPTIAQLNRITNFASETVKKYLKIIEEIDKKQIA